MKRKGWFIIPGVQDGARPLEAQLAAVRPAIAECSGKTVCDLGTAEGLVAIEFARAGAASVYGNDSIAGNIEVADQLKAREPAEVQRRLRFETRELANLIAEEGPGAPRFQYDVVLALGILHKLGDPRVGVEFVIAATRELLLMRSGQAQEEGIITSKFGQREKTKVDAHAMLRAAGFQLEKKLTGPAPWREHVEYWRRQPAAA